MPLSPALYLISLIYSKDFSHLQGIEELSPLLPSQVSTQFLSLFTPPLLQQSISRGRSMLLLDEVT